MPTQAEKGATFKALHERDHAFLIPNPYDAGTARLLQSLGFEALATTSAGYAFTLGKPDGAVGRDAMLEHSANVVAATDLPVSADLENGYADDPAEVAETVRLAAAAGLAGCSIEDTPPEGERAPYALAFAAERVRAAAEAAHALPFPFVLTARAENYLLGRNDRADTIARLQAFARAGADVVYAPGLKTADDIAAVVAAVDRPVNVIMGISAMYLSVAQVSALGVKRISVGSALSRAALGTFMNAAREFRDKGSFTFAHYAVPFADLNRMFAEEAP